MVVASANDLKPLRVRLFRNTVAPTIPAVTVGARHLPSRSARSDRVGPV
jgi:hypothetical protein